ncbi:hypothetical protein R2R35_19365 [Anaerocolumna sp. AGMB13020]|uniref:hypothetical protein n=1 Tax=Anaerocolumna sp. AGMB13020 TaxID=3081750 RepID=UPI002954EBCF|nr:hypothetical protein [Anaerocolumna sp. AGMB13020]WOO35933.1 hypothetical protein R2R35_19365 [Anaerocolumna sp. AGMB13020]
MVKHMIDFRDIIAKGRVECEPVEDMLHVRTKHAIPSQRFDAEHLSVNSYIALPGTFKLPLRIDITAQLDEPGLYLLVGKGRINFGTLCSDNRRMDDIIKPARKVFFYHNQMPMKEFTDLSVTYNLKEMQILIQGEERYYSQKEKYMKASEFPERNEEGFSIKIACDKFVNLMIKSITVTEYEDDCKIIRQGKELPPAITTNQWEVSGEKLSMEACIARLPDEIQKSILCMDDYFKSIKNLKLKRSIERNGNKITYVSSDYGFSYAIYVGNELFKHSLQWYLITKGKPETWHRKADFMEETLSSLQTSNQEFAQRMYNDLEECVGCYGLCLARTPYSFGDRKKYVCHGKLFFQMNKAGFDDARTFVDEINQVVQRKEIASKSS